MTSFRPFLYVSLFASFCIFKYTSRNIYIKCVQFYHKISKCRNVNYVLSRVKFLWVVPNKKVIKLIWNLQFYLLDRKESLLLNPCWCPNQIYLKWVWHASPKWVRHMYAQVACICLCKFIMKLFRAVLKRDCSEDILRKTFLEKHSWQSSFLY